MSRVHVLMCCHNGERFVREQLASIAAQERPVQMIHVHDFASRDGTVQVVEAFAHGSAAPVALTCHADAPGASLSFFRALASLAASLANDDVVLLADQDDVWLPHKTRKLLAAFETIPEPERAVFHDVIVVDSELAELRPTYYTGNPFALPRDLHHDRLLLASPVIGHTLVVSAPLVQRVVRMARPQRYLMHDWSLVLFASRFGRIGFVPEALSLYRQHSANVLGAYGRRRLRDVLRRVGGFSDAVVQQALAFTHDIEPAAGECRQRGRVDRWLQALSRRAPSAAYGVLAASAFVLGPTLQRKGLAIFIAAHGIRRSFNNIMRTRSS